MPLLLLPSCVCIVQSCVWLSYWTVIRRSGCRTSFLCFQLAFFSFSFTNPSFLFLFQYRDESERLAAFEAGVEAKKEAERLEREQNIIRSFVEIPMHPLHMYFVDMCSGENERSKRRARNRNQLKTFSLDLITLWHANRPDNEEGSSKMGPEGQISRIKGLMNRRPGHAIKAFNAQVQSVSIERAMQGAMSSSQLHLMGKFGGAKGGGSSDGGNMEGIVTQSEKDAADAEATRQRRMMWQRPWYRTTTSLPVLEDGPPGAVETLLALTWDCYEGRHQNEKLERMTQKERMHKEMNNREGGSDSGGGGASGGGEDGGGVATTNVAANNVENPEEESSNNERVQYASAGVSIFRRGRGDLRRLVIHVHDTFETTASALQISEKDADLYLQQYAVGRLKRQRAKELKEYQEYERVVRREMLKEENQWLARVKRREENTLLREQQRKDNRTNGAAATFTTAAEFGCNIQGKYVLMTIDVGVPEQQPIPNAACLRCQAYNPLGKREMVVVVVVSLFVGWLVWLVPVSHFHTFILSCCCLCFAFLFHTPQIVPRPPLICWGWMC